MFFQVQIFPSEYYSVPLSIKSKLVKSLVGLRNHIVAKVPLVYTFWFGVPSAESVSVTNRIAWWQVYNLFTLLNDVQPKYSAVVRSFEVVVVGDISRKYRIPPVVFVSFKIYIRKNIYIVIITN